MTRPTNKHLGLPAVFVLQALFSLLVVSLFIYAVAELALGMYSANASVTLGDSIRFTAYCTIFGMWLLFGILFIVLRFKVIDPISQLTQSMRDITNGRKWGERLATDAHIREIDSLVEDFNMLVDAVERERNLLRESSIRDPLTGLHNRRGFEDALLVEVERSRRARSQFSIILIDMDNFKSINDTYGHPAGDFVLCGMVSRLQNVLRVTDTFARVGGDEFLLILPDASPEAGRDVAQKLHNEMNRAQFAVSDAGITVIPVTASIGVASYPRDGHDSITLRQAVDAVLYKAKRAGKNCVVALCTDDIQASISSQSKLRTALEEGRVEAAFQPIVSVSDGNIFAYEALARIFENGSHHPAMNFIDTVMEPQLAKDIDAMVFQKGLVRLANSSSTERYRMFFNLSSSTFADKAWMLSIPTMLKAAGVSGDRVVFEITEREMLPGLDIVRTVIAELRLHGIMFAIDDFGTGFSSFAYVQQLDVDFLKIDGSFVRDIAHNVGDRTIVESISRFGKSFGVTVIAEYVEDERTLQILRELGISAAQGFHFGRPEVPQT